MEKIVTIMNAALIGSKFFKGVALKKLLSKVVGLVILTIISSIMMCMLLIFALYISYNLMLQNGIDQHIALLIFSLVVLVLMAIFTNLAIKSFRSLQGLLALSSKQKSELGKIIEAFKDGLLKK